MAKQKLKIVSLTQKDYKVMYKRSTKIVVEGVNPKNYIEGFDVYIARLLDLLKDESIVKNDYKITTYEYRPDLIAKDIYGDEKYEGLLLLMCGMGLENYTKGAILHYIPIIKLTEILNSL